MNESFGARMRQHRQQRKVPLRTIAEQTKIKLSMLEGLEKDDISQWPAGIFRRAYVRSYANAVGLDPDTVVREFLEQHPEPVEVVESQADQSGPPVTRFRSMVGSALERLRRGSAPDSKPEAELPPLAPPVVAASAVVAPPVQAPPVEAPAAVATPVRNVSVATVGRDEPTHPDWLAAARVCTELGRVQRLSDVKPLLRDAAGIAGAVGLIVWVWDSAAAELKPALSHGYSSKVMARLRGVTRDEDNLTAAAFRSGETLAVSGEGRGAGALAIPLMAPSECVGVLAIELPRGSEQSPQIRAVATFFAAMLAQLFAGQPASSPATSPASRPASPSSSEPDAVSALGAYPADQMLPATSCGRNDGPLIVRAWHRWAYFDAED